MTTLAALAKAQAEVKDAFTDKNNAHLKSKYASFGSILDAVRPALQKNGLVLLFDTELVNDGQFVAVSAGVVTADSDPANRLDLARTQVFYPFNLGWTPQQVNAAFTYGKKATLLALFAITSTEELEADDDGHTVSNTKAEPIDPGTLNQILGLLEVLKGSRDDAALAQSFGKVSASEFTLEEGQRAIKALQAAQKRAKGAK